MSQKINQIQKMEYPVLQVFYVYFGTIKQN